MKKRNLFFLIVSFQIIFLCGMVGYHKIKLKNSTRIVLKTAPVDPYSVFRGAYVSLRYDIGTLSDELLVDAKSSDLKRNQTLYVVLVPTQKGYWDASEIYTQKPNGKFFIRGRLPDYFYPKFSGGNVLRLRYDIESFFLDAKSAHVVEQGGTTGDLQSRDLQQKRMLEDLDPEIYRIYHSGPKKWYFDKIKPELSFWVDQGLITLESKDKIIEKYANAYSEIERVSKSLREPSDPSDWILVQVAIDKQGNAYPTKLTYKGEEYK